MDKQNGLSFYEHSGSSPPQRKCREETSKRIPEKNSTKDLQNGLHDSDGLELIGADEIFDNQIYTVTEAARLMRCCAKTIYRAIKKKHLRAKRLSGGRAIRILGLELIGWMKGGNYAN